MKIRTGEDVKKVQSFNRHKCLFIWSRDHETWVQTSGTTDSVGCWTGGTLVPKEGIRLSCWWRRGAEGARQQVSEPHPATCSFLAGESRGGAPSHRVSLTWPHVPNAAALKWIKPRLAHFSQSPRRLIRRPAASGVEATPFECAWSHSHADNHLQPWLHEIRYPGFQLPVGGWTWASSGAVSRVAERYERMGVIQTSDGSSKGLDNL